MKKRRSGVGQVIHAYRRERSLTQVEAAAQVGVTQATFSAWENGVQLPRLKSIPAQKLLEALQIPSEEFESAYRQSSGRGRTDEGAAITARVVHVLSVLRVKCGVRPTLELIELLAENRSLLDEAPKAEVVEMSPLFRLLEMMVSRAGEVPVSEIERYFPRGSGSPSD